MSDEGQLLYCEEQLISQLDLHSCIVGRVKVHAVNREGLETATEVWRRSGRRAQDQSRADHSWWNPRQHHTRRKMLLYVTQATAIIVRAIKSRNCKSREWLGHDAYIY